MSFDLSQLRGAHFSDKIGHQFTIEGVNGALPVELVEVREGEKPLMRSGIRPPFTLLFRCVIPVNIRSHEQFNIRHKTLGLLENIFIGPVLVPDPEWGEGMYWEAIFT
jgi:hypothetical protein